MKTFERQCKEGLMINEYKEGKVINRRGEWGENLSPDFGVLEDKIYRVIRKKVEISQQGPDKSSKRQRLEVRERTEVCESDATTDKALTTGMTMSAGSTQCAAILIVEADTHGYSGESINMMSDLNSPS